MPTFNGRCARHGSTEKAAGNNAASTAMLSSDFVVIFTAPWFASNNCRCLITASFGTLFFDQLHSISPSLVNELVRRDSGFFLTAGRWRSKGRPLAACQCLHGPPPVDEDRRDETDERVARTLGSGLGKLPAAPKREPVAPSKIGP
jgi:hypothetical protein